MHKILMAGLLVSGSLACSDSRRASDTTGGRAGAPVAGSLAVGTTVQATIQDSISSRTSQLGSHVHAIVSRNVVDAAGRIVIAGGAPLELTIVKLAPATNAAADGILVLEVTSVNAGATTYTPAATVGAVTHALVGRGAAATLRDLIVSPGTPVTITLAQPLKISATLDVSASDRVHMYQVRRV
jgi:hypothetical protein